MGYDSDSSDSSDSGSDSGWEEEREDPREDPLDWEIFALLRRCGFVVRPDCFNEFKRAFTSRLYKKDIAKHQCDDNTAFILGKPHSDFFMDRRVYVHIEGNRVDMYTDIANIDPMCVLNTLDMEFYNLNMKPGMRFISQRSDALADTMGEDIQLIVALLVYVLKNKQDQRVNLNTDIISEAIKTVFSSTCLKSNKINNALCDVLDNIVSSVYVFNSKNARKMLENFVTQHTAVSEAVKNAVEIFKTCHFHSKFANTAIIRMVKMPHRSIRQNFTEEYIQQTLKKTLDAMDAMHAMQGPVYTPREEKYTILTKTALTVVTSGPDCLSIIKRTPTGSWRRKKQFKGQFYKACVIGHIVYAVTRDKTIMADDGDPPDTSFDFADMQNNSFAYILNGTLCWIAFVKSNFNFIKFKYTAKQRVEVPQKSFELIRIKKNVIKCRIDGKIYTYSDHTCTTLCDVCSNVGHKLRGRRKPSADDEHNKECLRNMAPNLFREVYGEDKVRVYDGYAHIGDKVVCIKDEEEDVYTMSHRGNREITPKLKHMFKKPNAGDTAVCKINGIVTKVEILKGMLHGYKVKDKHGDEYVVVGVQSYISDEYVDVCYFGLLLRVKNINYDVKRGVFKVAAGTFEFEVGQKYVLQYCSSAFFDVQRQPTAVQQKIKRVLEIYKEKRLKGYFLSRDVLEARKQESAMLRKQIQSMKTKTIEAKRGVKRPKHTAETNKKRQKQRLKMSLNRLKLRRI